MAYAEPAYRFGRQAAYVPAYSRSSAAPAPSAAPAEPARRRAPGVRVERTGRRASEAERSQSSLLVTAAAMAAIVLVVIAALSFARIALTSATVTTLIESDSLSAQIETARSTGVSLEMEQSVLSNTYAVEAAAKRLGMYEPDAIHTIMLAPDVVAVDASGALSLSQSVKSLVEIQA